MRNVIKKTSIIIIYVLASVFRSIFLCIKTPPLEHSCQNQSNKSAVKSRLPHGSYREKKWIYACLQESRSPICILLRHVWAQLMAVSLVGKSWLAKYKVGLYEHYTSICDLLGYPAATIMHSSYVIHRYKLILARKQLVTLAVIFQFSVRRS